MKRRITSCILLALALSLSGYALEVPTDAVIQNLNGVQQYVKTYTVSPETDPQELMEEPFDYEGFTYRYASITKAENRFTEEKTHTETVTAETAKKDLSAVLEALPATVEYDDGHYKGTLYLDHTTIKTAASGYKTQSQTISTTKEYGNLDSNDLSYIPATAVKNGRTLPLVNVEWQVQGSGLVDDVLVPSTYKAIATYSDRAYYSAATGYVTTADYTGTVTCQEVDSITYTVTYVGEELPPVQEKTLPDSPAAPWGYVTAGLLTAAVAAGCFVCYKAKRGKNQKRKARSDYYEAL